MIEEIIRGEFILIIGGFIYDSSNFFFLMIEGNIRGGFRLVIWDLYMIVVNFFFDDREDFRSRSRLIIWGSIYGNSEIFF